MDEKDNEIEKALAEFERDAEFQCMSIGDAVEAYKPYCKSFSLASLYCREEDEADFTISPEHYNFALKEVEEDAKSASKRCYEELTQEQKDAIPPFDTLYFDICAEFDKRMKESLDAQPTKFEDLSFGRGFELKTRKYIQTFLDGFYYALGRAAKRKYILERLKRNNRPCNITRELDGYECYRTLRYALKKVEVTFFPPLGSTALMRVFHFELDEDTEYWLTYSYEEVWDAFETIFGLKPPLKYFTLHDGNGKPIFWRDDDIGFQNGIILEKLKDLYE